MQVIMMMIQLFQRTAIGYGKMFMIIGTLIEEGGKVFTETMKVLEHEKYKHIKDGLQAAVLHLIAAVAEFKKAGKAFEKAVIDNPDDFKVAMEFIAKVQKDLPESLEECFKGMEEIIKSSDVKAKIPAFIRESGEYMDLVNQGYIEVDEKTFKELIVKDNQYIPDYLVRELGKAQDSIDVKGWAKYTTLEKKGKDEIINRYILWANEFKFDDVIPEGVKVVEEVGEDTSDFRFVKANNVIYMAPRRAKGTVD